MAVFDSKSSATVPYSVLQKAFEASVPLDWLGFGVATGLGFAIVLGLIFGSQTLRRSVWVSQLLFVVSGLTTLSFAFLAGAHFGEFGGKIFSTLIRVQLILSTIGTFNIVTPTLSKQNLGFIYSAFLGAMFSASLVNFLVPIEGLLFFSDLALLSSSLYLGSRFLRNLEGQRLGEKTLFYQLTTVFLMGFTIFWIPDFSNLNQGSLFVFAVLSFAMLVMSASTSLSSSRERTITLITRLQKELFVSERRLAKQNQILSSQHIEIQELSTGLQNEVKEHRQDSIRDHLRIRALEESSQDIAHGMRALLKELQEDCQLVVLESKSSRYRMAFIRAYAERMNLALSRVQNTAGFLLVTEAALDFSSEKDQILNASDFLKECLFLCRAKFKKVGIEVEIQSLATDLMIRGKPALLAQGFLGLIYNALEATETADVRKVTLILQKVERAGESFVEFGISNSGPGIPTVIKAKAFHAKERDGLGIHSLGLSMAFGIFEHAGGSLQLDTDAVATTLLARLPLVEKTEESSLRLVI